MEVPDFTQFMLEKINESPEAAEVNSAILSLYEKGLLHVYWDSNTGDFLIQTSLLGEQSFHESIANNFVPAEA